MSITIQYVWLVGSLGFFGIWLAVFFLTEKESRKEMLIVSLMTSLFGLLAQFFIRQYWDPPTLFSIIHKAGFSIENIIFAFSVGGVAIAIYKAIFKYPSEAKGGDKDAVLVAYPSEAKGGDKDAVLVAYPSEAKGGDKDAVLVAYPSEAKGGEKRTFFDYRRRGKAVKILIGGMIFAGLYFIFFSSFNWAFPGYSEQAWSFQIFSGMKIFGVPIKGVFPFFILGIIWSGFYECLTWRAIKRSG